MASIRKRTNKDENKYQVRIRVLNHPTITKTFNLHSSAKAWARETEIKIEKGLLSVGDDRSTDTLQEVLERYLSEVTPCKRGQSVEGIRIRKLIRDPIATTKFSALRSHHIIEYRDRRSKEVSGSTVKRDLNLLGHVLETANKEWGMPSNGNPVQLITKPKANKPRDRRLENDEESRLLSASADSQNIYLRSLIIVVIETAMRRSEILTLDRRHISLNSRTAYLPITKNGDSRNVPLSSRAIGILSQIPVHMTGKVFPISETALRGLWKRACNRADIKGLRFHDLRHEATSRFFEKGLNVMEVAAITGHKDLRMLQRYTHLRAEDLAKKLG